MIPLDAVSSGVDIVSYKAIKYDFIKNLICEITEFVRIFWKNNIQRLDPSQFRRICMESQEYNWANISDTICPEVLRFGQ